MSENNEQHDDHGHDDGHHEVAWACVWITLITAFGIALVKAATRHQQLHAPQVGKEDHEVDVDHVAPLSWLCSSQVWLQT